MHLKLPKIITKNYKNVEFDKERCINEGKEYALKLSKSVKVIQDVKEKSIAKAKLIAEALKLFHLN